MGVEFRLGSGDHRVVEDFLASKPAGVSAIVLSSRGSTREEDVAVQAADSGLDVHWDPMTDRLVRPGFSVPGISEHLGQLDPAALQTSAEARSRLVKVVAAATPRYATTATPPHFVVDTIQDAMLNLELASSFRDEVGTRSTVRPVLTIAAQLPIDETSEIAAGIAAAGFTQAELRVTPFSGEDDSARKVRAVLSASQAFHTSGLEVTLGSSGNLGQAALALGVVDHFSVGIGSLEHVNHASTLNRQQQERSTQRGFPPYVGVYLNGLALTAPPKLGKALLEDPRIRSRFACKHLGCRNDVTAPVRDPRPHYLHSRAHEAELVLGRPPNWRVTGERDRFHRALELRQRINQKFLPDNVKALKTRTLAALVALLSESQSLELDD